MAGALWIGAVTLVLFAAVAVLAWQTMEPGKFRTLVPLSNFGPFYEAFEIESGDTWYRKPEERVQIW